MKQFILSLVLTVAASAIHAADNVWCMVTQNGQAVAMSQVHYLLSLGNDNEAFTIVCRDGATIENVTKVTFSQTEPTVISGIALHHETALLSTIAAGAITLMGCAEGTPVAIATLSGQTVATATTESRQTTIDISSLAEGIYILTVGQTAIKFTKH